MPNAFERFTNGVGEVVNDVNWPLVGLFSVLVLVGGGLGLFAAHQIGTMVDEGDDAIDKLRRQGRR